MHFADSLFASVRMWRRGSIFRCPTRQNSTRVVSGPAERDRPQVKQTLERILNENIVPFWYPRTLDMQEGGYSLNHDREGNWRGPSSKHLVTQARTVWFFARLATSRYGTQDYLQAARHGYEFLRDRMWDRDFGGLYWEVDCSGRIAIKPDKLLYGQAFALYAFSEYAEALQDSSAASLAEELFNLIETQAHDPQCGGYRESFQRDWNVSSLDRASYLALTPDCKSMNTHLHLLEAITSYYRLTGDPIAQKRRPS